MSKSTERPTRREALLGDREGAYAIARYLRMSATKVRRVVDNVRGMDVNSALAALRFAPQAAAEPVYKVLASAVANAEQNEALNADDLFISQIFVDEGVTLRRIRPRAKGSADRISKRGAHVTVVVEPFENKELIEAARKSRKASAAEIDEAAQVATELMEKAAKASEAKAEEKPAKKAKAEADEPKAKKSKKADAEKSASDDKAEADDTASESKGA
jgi:large subunit ribosomal protein L22